MKARYTFSLWVCLIPAICLSQVPFSVANPHPLDLPGYGMSVRTAADSLLVFTRKVAMDQHAFNCYTEMYGPDGTLLWEKQHYAVRNTYCGEQDAVSSIMADGSFCTGMVSYDGALGDSLFLRRFDPAGESLSEHFLFTTGRIWPTDAIVHDDTCYLAGSAMDSTGADVVAYLTKVDTGGTISWTLNFPSIWSPSVGIAANQHDQIFVTGEANSGFLPVTSKLIAIDPSGAQLWSRTLLTGQSSYSAWATRVVCDLDGHPVVGGTCTADWPYSESRQFVAKYNRTNGAPLWLRIFDTSVNETSELWDLEAATNGDFIACGSLPVDEPPGWSACAYRISDQGVVKWTRRYRYLTNPAAENRLVDIEELPDGGFAMTGTTQLAAYLGTVIWVVRTDTAGCIVPGCGSVGTDEILVSPIPLLKVQPVPTNGPLTITLAAEALPYASAGATLSILDPKGTCVRKLALNTQGRQLVDLSDLSRGIYFIHAQAGTTLLGSARIVLE